MSVSPSQVFIASLGSALANWAAPGLNDFSMESWWHGRFPTELVDNDMEWHFNVWQTSLGSANVNSIVLDNNNISNGWGIFDALMGTDLDNGPIPTNVYRWFYIYSGYDRDGNAELWVDNQLVSQLDISGSVALNFANAVHLGPFGIDRTAVEWRPMWLGPFAAHRRLLTAQERHNSQQQGTTANIMDYTWYACDPRDAITFDEDYDILDTNDQEMDEYLGNAVVGETSTVSYRGGLFGREHPLRASAYSALFENKARGALSVGGAPVGFMGDTPVERIANIDVANIETRKVP